MNILYHICCGPCALYPLLKLADEGHEVTGLWYNPNIHPYQEYRRRLNTVTRELEAHGIPLIVNDRYELERHLERVLAAMHEGRIRCGECYSLRLGEAARVAAERGIPALTTSLLISPHQEHELVRRAGEEAAARHGLQFYYRDFRPWYQEARQLAASEVMYRQSYCGCIFSERERYHWGYLPETRGNG